MSKEQANQSLRENKGELVGYTKVNEDQVRKIMTDFDKVTYLPIDDFIDLLRKSCKLLTPIANNSQGEFAYGVDASVAHSMLCSVLRVPKKADVSKDKSGREKQASEDVDKYRKNHLAAQAVSRAIYIDDTETCDYEDFHRALMNHDDSEAVKRILMRPKMDTSHLSLPNNEVLPSFKTAPRSLPCKNKFLVSLDILYVNTYDLEAFVTLRASETIKDTALKPLVDKNIIMKLPKKSAKFFDTLIAPQLLKYQIQCKVSATLALRDRDFNQNKLIFISFANDKSHKEMITKGLHQMSLDFS